MQDTVFVVVDNNYRNRHELTLALSGMGYVVPADTLEDLGSRWPEQAWLLVHDEGTQLAETQQALRAAERYYPLVAYAGEASIGHVMEVLGSGAAGYLEWPLEPAQMQRNLAAILASKWQSATATLGQARAKQRIGLLSPLEKEVLSSV